MEGLAPEHTVSSTAGITKRRERRIGCSQIGRDNVAFCKTTALTTALQRVYGP
jgi:hypothetical protein